MKRKSLVRRVFLPNKAKHGYRIKRYGRFMRFLRELVGLYAGPPLDSTDEAFIASKMDGTAPTGTVGTMRETRGKEHKWETPPNLVVQPKHIKKPIKRPEATRGITWDRKV